MAERPFKLNLIMIIYLLGSIGLIGIIVMVWITDIPEDLIATLFPGGIFIGDTTVSVAQIIWAMNYFFGPLFMVMGICTLPAVYAMYGLKSWGLKYTLLISMFWTLFLVGLIVVWIFLQDDIKQLFNPL